MMFGLDLSDIGDLGQLIAAIAGALALPFTAYKTVQWYKRRVEEKESRLRIMEGNIKTNEKMIEMLHDDVDDVKKDYDAGMKTCSFYNEQVKSVITEMKYIREITPIVQELNRDVSNMIKIFEERAMVTEKQNNEVLHELKELNKTVGAQNAALAVQDVRIKYLENKVNGKAEIS